MRRLLGAVALAASLLAPAVTVAPAGAYARANLNYAHLAVSTTNKVRVVRGYAVLDHSTCLAHLAWAQAYRMARQRRIFHQDMSTAMRTCHLTAAAENVAAGYPTGARVVYDGWMKSAPHRANILCRRYGRMAIGAVRSPSGRWYVSQVFGRHA